MLITSENHKATHCTTTVKWLRRTFQWPFNQEPLCCGLFGDLAPRNNVTLDSPRLTFEFQPKHTITSVIQIHGNAVPPTSKEILPHADRLSGSCPIRRTTTLCLCLSNCPSSMKPAALGLRFPFPSRVLVALLAMAGLHQTRIAAMLFGLLTSTLCAKIDTYLAASVVTGQVYNITSSPKDQPVSESA